MNKILLVEDDYYLGLILNDQLEMNGYEVSLLRSPSQTVENLLEGNFDLVIMDKLLSGTDGTQLCTEIRNTESISQTPVLMMSGMDGAREVCLAAGANSFIAKPFEVDAFLRSIETTIAKAGDFQG
jgi:DNA-binding response OmpR family regulator